jgi:DNA-binding NtrC family response regulator
LSTTTEKLNLRVLLVDDEDIVLDVGARMLEKIGYSVFTAKNGKAAVDIFREHRAQICLVILDLAMPEMDGESAFELLKEIQPEVKVLISSGVSLPDKAGDRLKYGCSGFIQKPFNLSNLSRKVEEIIRR